MNHRSQRPAVGVHVVQFLPHRLQSLEILRSDVRDVLEPLAARRHGKRGLHDRGVLLGYAPQDDAADARAVRRRD